MPEELKYQQDQPQGQQDNAAPEKDDASKDAEYAAVTMWCARIRKAKSKFKEDFDRMRENMDMVAGFQWKGQKTMREQKYICNFLNNETNTKVATLYARNPTAEYQRRKRLNFELYDGKLESIMPLVAGAMQHPMGLAALPLQARALLLDFQHGIEEDAMIDKVGRTLEILFQYTLDEQDEEDSDSKLQFKQLVRRAVIAGVGYVGVSFVRDVDNTVSSTGASDSMSNRAKQAAALLEKIEEGDIERSSAQMETLQSLFLGLASGLSGQASPEVNERVVLDFMPATSVIVDTRCRALKGFIGARWIAQEFILPVSDVNAIFECDVKIGEGTKLYSGSGKEVRQPSSDEGAKNKDDQQCCLWRVYDKRTKTTFYLVDGYKCYVNPPEALEPSVRGFWTIRALTFNDVEVEDGCNATIYPPSDVQLLMSPQKEWNRTREELKKHRKANAPGWMAAKGMLTSEDKEQLQAAPTNAVTELQGVPQGVPLDKVFCPRPTVPIQGELYDTSAMVQDMLMATGSQQNNIAQGQPNATATGQTIVEQSKMTVTSSNVDDLDDCLSFVARVSGEMMLKEMSPDTVQRIAGRGAAWPQQDEVRKEFLNQIYLTTKAASSGRPNKQIELRNWQIAGPILQQAGANPQFIVRETLRRLDDQLDPEQAFPLSMPNMPAQQVPQGGQHQPSPQGQHEPGVTPPPQQQRPGPGGQPPK